ncbi:hypothetical protein THAOC_36126, partial [Thalassiosira oceanica]
TALDEKSKIKSGEYGNRIRDFPHAKRALYQLS